jgi:hypothetical protein
MNMGQNCTLHFPTVGSKRINTAVGKRLKNHPDAAFFAAQLKYISFKNQWINRSNPDTRI